VTVIGRLRRGWLIAFVVTIAAAAPPPAAFADDRLIDAVKRRDVMAVQSLIKARVDVNEPE
jgi:hypothetical protein